MRRRYGDMQCVIRPSFGNGVRADQCRRQGFRGGFNQKDRNAIDAAEPLLHSVRVAVRAFTNHQLRHEKVKVFAGS